MKPPTDQELTSFVAELLKVEIYHCGSSLFYRLPEIAEGWEDNQHYVIPSELQRLYFDSDYAPIIRHLIEEEMERRGYWWEQNWTYNTETKETYHHCDFYKVFSDIAEGRNDNKTRAVALAAYRALEGRA